MTGKDIQKTKLKRLPFWYNASMTLTALTLTQQTFNINSMFDFLATGFSYVAVTAVANAIPYFNIMIRKEEDTLFSNPIPNQMFTGMNIETVAAPDNRYPVGLAIWQKFPCPYIFNASCQMIVELTETAGNATVVNFSIQGIRLYKYS